MGLLVVGVAEVGRLRAVDVERGPRGRMFVGRILESCKG